MKKILTGFIAVASFLFLFGGGANIMATHDGSTFTWVNKNEIRGRYTFDGQTININYEYIGARVDPRNERTVTGYVYRGSQDRLPCTGEIITGPTDFSSGSISINQSLSYDPDYCRELSDFNHMPRDITLLQTGNGPSLSNPPGPAQNPDLPFDYRLFRHMHVQAFEDDGSNITSAEFDGSGGEVELFLVDPSDNIVWQICPTHPGKTQTGIEHFYLNPSFGNAANIGTDPRFPVVPLSNYQDLKKPGCRSTEINDHFGRSENHYKGFHTGETWKIVGFGIGGDSPWNPVDGNSQFFEVMTISIANATNYSYSGRRALKEGSNDTCPGGSSENNKCVAGEIYKVDYDPSNATCRRHPSPCPSHDVVNNGANGSNKDFVFNVFSTSGGGLISIINSVLNFFVDQMRQMILRLNALVQNVITIPHSYFTAEGSDKGLVDAWNVARSLANTLFVLVLIVLAMANILRYQIEKYDVRATIPRLIVAVILTNFSLLLIGMLVDITNVATISIKSGFDAAAGANTADAIDIATGSAQGLFAILLTVVMFVILLIVVLWVVILLAFRVAVIFAMAALAPIAFMFFSLPATAGMLQTWWKNLVRFLIMGPVIMFLLAMSGTIITSLQRESQGDDLALMISFFVAIGFVAIAGMVPVMLGGRAFDAAGGWAKRIGAFAGKRAAGSALGRGVARTLQGASLSRVPGLNKVPGFKEGQFFGKRGLPGAKGVGTRLGAYSAGISGERQKRVSAAASIMSNNSLKSRLKNSTNPDEVYALGAALAERNALATETKEDKDGNVVVDDTLVRRFLNSSGPNQAKAVGIAIKASKEVDPNIADVIGKSKIKGVSLPAKYRSTTELVRSTSVQNMGNYGANVLKNTEIRKVIKITDARQIQGWSAAHIDAALDNGGAGWDDKSLSYLREKSGSTDTKSKKKDDRPEGDAGYL